MAGKFEDKGKPKAKEDEGFFDFSASDLIGAYLKKEEAQATASSNALAMQGETQNRNLNAAMIGSPAVAVDSGYVDRFTASTKNANWPIIGAVVLALGGFFLVAFK
jgi:hypothetical protein